MLPITPSTVPGHDLRVHDLVAVFRLVRTPSAPLTAVLGRATADRPSLPLGDEGRLELVTGFSAVPGTRGRWQARARLHGRGLRLVPYARVDVEITPWSPDASELRVRPVTRSPHVWGVRRLQRYLRLAPMAADALVDHLSAAAKAVSATVPGANATAAGPRHAASPVPPTGPADGVTPRGAARRPTAA